jgi:hypothetical protein
MGKIEKYQDILIDYLSEYARNSRPVNLPDVEAKVVSDKETNSFQFLRIGWQGDRFIFSVVFHFDIKPNGKVWLQINNTEREVVDVLMEKGILKEDIVLGFQPPYARTLLGFAAA